MQGGAARREQPDHGPDAVLVGRKVLLDGEGSGKPAAAQGHIRSLENGQHFFRSGREAPALFHAGKTGRARLEQAFLQRNVVRRFHQIVIPPGDGRHSEFCFQESAPVLGKALTVAGERYMLWAAAAVRRARMASEPKLLARSLNSPTAAFGASVRTPRVRR